MIHDEMQNYAVMIGESTFSTQNPRASDGHVASRIARHDWLRSYLVNTAQKNEEKFVLSVKKTFDNFQTWIFSVTSAQ